MHITPLLYQFLLILTNFGLFLGGPFFFNFFPLIITYQVFFILDYPHFIIFYVFFWIKMHKIPIFYQFFLIFDHFDLIFGPPLLFFSYFFQSILTNLVIIILEYPHFVIFYVFFWIKMHILPIFYQFFSFLTNLT